MGEAEKVWCSCAAPPHGLPRVACRAVLPADAAQFTSSTSTSPIERARLCSCSTPIADSLETCRKCNLSGFPCIMGRAVDACGRLFWQHIALSADLPAPKPGRIGLLACPDEGLGTKAIVERRMPFKSVHGGLPPDRSTDFNQLICLVTAVANASQFPYLERIRHECCPMLEY